MQTEETKDRCADFGCCNPENFKGMFGKSSKCFSGRNGSAEFSAMKDGMLKKMMEIGCRPKPADIKKDTDSQKENNGETEAT